MPGPVWLYNGRLMPPGSQAQADKPHPEAWPRSQMGGIDMTEYSFTELDHPVSKLTRVNARGGEWKSRIELWIEDVRGCRPIPDPKATAAILKEARELGGYLQIQFHRTETNGRRFSFKRLAAGTKEDPVVID